MNNSGTAIKELIDYFKIDAKDVFVFHDDLDIDFGKIKAQFGGSSAGHNGIESIDKFMELMPQDYEHYDIIKDILSKMINNLIYTAPELRLHKLYNIFFNLYTYLPKKNVKWAEICWGDMLDTYNKSVEIINSRN